jgi:hypothetical protein
MRQNGWRHVISAGQSPQSAVIISTLERVQFGFADCFGSAASQVQEKMGDPYDRHRAGKCALYKPQAELIGNCETRLEHQSQFNCWARRAI